MNTITASIDGLTYTVVLHRVTGRDALEYRGATGEDLDYRVGVLIALGAAGREMPLADASVVKWLWTRQNVDPTASLGPVAETVTLFPEPSPEQPPPTGAATSSRPEGE